MAAATFHPAQGSARMNSRLMMLTVLMLVACQGCLGAALRGGHLTIGSAFHRPDQQPTEQTIQPAGKDKSQETQQPNTLLHLLGHAVSDILDDILPTQLNPVNTCSVAELLAWSENVGSELRGSLHVGEALEVSCLPGYIPPPGLSNVVSVKCLRGSQGNAFWDLDSRLNCGLPCQNSQLVSDMGLPIQSKGVTPPQGRMEMKCTLRSMTTVYAVCQADGQWLSERPCQPCDTSDLLAGNDMTVTLSAGGMLLPYSKIHMSCPKGMHAYPAARVTVTCKPGGMWEVPSFECRQTGCDTADLFPGLVDPEMEGLLGVGATLLVRRTSQQASGLAVTYYTSQCQENGTWTDLPYNTASGDIWDNLLADADISY